MTEQFWSSFISLRALPMLLHPNMISKKRGHLRSNYHEGDTKIVN